MYFSLAVCAYTNTGMCTSVYMCLFVCVYGSMNACSFMYESMLCVNACEAIYNHSENI